MQEFLTHLQNMTIGEIVGSGAVIILILSTFIEITPIKWNPLSAIFSWIGKRMNGKLIDQVEAQGEEIKKIDEKIDMNEIDRIRWEILEFANSCRHDQRHTKDEFEHIINQHEKYVRILDERELTNGLITIEYEYIEDVYKKCLEKNNFL